VNSEPQRQTPERRRWSPGEDLSVDELARLQLRRLRDQVSRLIATNPFHRERFRSAGVDAESLTSLADLRRFPTMSKSDVLVDTADHPPFGRRLGVRREEIREIVTSGGTAGHQPEVFAYTRQDLDVAVEIYAMDQYWKGAATGDIAMMISQLGMLTSPPMNVRAWERLGLAVLRLGPNSTEERVEAFARFRPSVLKLPYAYAPRFMLACREAGIDPRRDVPNLKYVFISGGAYPLSFAEEVTDFFAAPMHEVFGCSQAGTVISGTCETGVYTERGRGWMHCFDHEFVIEVLDPVTGEPVPEGSDGELVITPLYREASPVFRYRMNDRVTRGGAMYCTCGRPFTTIECGTAARFDDMLKIKGVNIWAHDLDAFILDEPHVDEFNGIVTIDDHGRECARVLVELRGIDDDPVARGVVVRRISERLKHAFRVSFEVVAVPAGTVKRFELKQRRWTDEREERLRDGRYDRGEMHANAHD